MPARTATQSAQTPKDVAALAVQLAGLIDDPLAYVRIRWGAYNAGDRPLKMQVIDRLDKPYAPRSFRGYRRREGTADGRWLIAWYVAESEFGTPLASAGTVTKGKTFGTIGSLYISETDETGAFEATISKGGTYTWCHAGVLGLLRDRGINWTTAPADPEQGQGTSGGGDLVIAGE